MNNEIVGKLNVLSHTYGFDSDEAKLLTEAALIIESLGNEYKRGVIEAANHADSLDEDSNIGFYIRKALICKKKSQPTK